MCYNKVAHLNQTKTPAGTEVTALWSGFVYTGEGVAAVCRKCVSGFRHYLRVGFGQPFKTAFELSCSVLHANLHRFILAPMDNKVVLV